MGAKNVEGPPVIDVPPCPWFGFGHPGDRMDEPPLLLHSATALGYCFNNVGSLPKLRVEHI